MTQTFLYNLARLGLDHISAGQPFLYNLARLGLASSLPGLALTTYLLANHFCTTLLGLALTTYLLANHFCTTLLGLALTMYLLANHFCTTLLGLASLRPCQAWPWPRICWPTISVHLARLGLDHVSAGQPFLYNLARLGLTSSWPGLALTTYLLANPFCTAVLVIKDTHQQLWLHSTKQILFFLGFEQLRHDVLIIISASCLGSSKF